MYTQLLIPFHPFDTIVSYRGFPFLFRHNATETLIYYYHSKVLQHSDFKTSTEQFLPIYANTCIQLHKEPTAEEGGEVPEASGLDLYMGEENVNCILGGLWLDRTDKLPASAVTTDDPAGAVADAADFEAADRGGAAAADAVERPRVKPGMLAIGRVKSVRRFGTSTTCKNPCQR